MKVNSIKCEAFDVRTESGICAGIAKTQKGEECIIDGRTPEANGMCSNAFFALSNAVFVMMTTEKMTGEENGSKDIVCTHGVVTFRLTRSNFIRRILKINYKRRYEMHCCSTKHSHNCHGSIDPQLWSKKKKLEVLKHHLDCIEEKKQDIQDAIDELKS